MKELSIDPGRKTLNDEAFKFISRKPLENILQYLSSCSESSTDVTIYCSDGTVAAHKLVLASLSKMLFKVFKCQDNEEDTSILLPDFTMAHISAYFREIFLGADVLQDPQYLNLNTTLALASEITKPPNNIQVKDEVNDSCDNEEIFSCDTKILFKKEDEDHENSEAFAVKLKENECFESYDDNEEMFSSVTTIIFKKEDRDHENSVESTVKLKEKIKSNVDTTENEEEINILNVLANDRGMYPCDQCDFEATTRRNLRAHKARTDGHREQGIKYCKRISKVWLHFTQDPTDEKRSVCKYCNASFSTNSRENTKHMASHLNSKHDILIEKRKMKITRNTNPVWEYLDEDPSDPYKVLCKICGLRLTRFSGPRHVKTKHDMGGTKEKFQCSYCPKTFRDGTHKKIHEIRKHTKNYEHHCEVCGKGFAERNVLEVHLAEEHNNTSEKNTKYVRKPVICPHCGSSFATKGSLQSHIKNIHEGFKFQCPYCDYSNGRKANLDMHIKIKHEGITLPCPHCNYKATRESNLKVHIKTVHEGLRFNCPHCDFQVTRKDYLEKHISSAHAAMISAS